MKRADTGIDEADSKERARGSCGVEGSLFDGDEVSTLRITIILTHEAQGTSTCTHKPHPLDTPHYHSNQPFVIIEQSSLFTTRSNLVGRWAIVCTQEVLDSL